MQYFLEQDHNTGNWWIVEQEEDGYRTIVNTLSARLNYLEARRYLEKHIEECENGK
jgi:hypothetical protein